MASYIQNIRKRNGDIVPFISQKITDAIRKANLESIDDTFTAKELERLTNEVTEAISAQDIPTVEFIQDTVEKVLIRNNFASTAKAYIIYRAEHTKIREAQGNLMDIYNELTFKKSADADIKRENANIDADTAMGTMLKYGSEGSKYYIDNYILPLPLPTLTATSISMTRIFTCSPRPAVRLTCLNYLRMVFPQATVI